MHCAEKMTLNRQDFRSGKHVIHNLNVHIVLVAKYRKKVMPETVRGTFKETIQDTCDRFGIELIEFNADTDHAHALINYPPKYSISEIVRALKTNSSREVRIVCADEIRDNLCGKQFWSPSYFVSSTGGASLEKVKEHVESQKQPPKPRGNPNLIRYGCLHSSPASRKGSPGGI